VASLSQGRTAAAQCGLFTYKSVPVIFEPPCNFVLSEIHCSKYLIPSPALGTILIYIFSSRCLPLKLISMLYLSFLWKFCQRFS